MISHRFAQWRLAQLLRQRAAHQRCCADCQGQFICTTFERLTRQIKHWQRVEGVA